MSAIAMRALGDVRESDVGEVGGKAASLGELLASGARVPPGVVLPAEAGSVAASERAEALRMVAGILGPGPFAVRSSGTAEDGAEHSYAGIFESVLDVAPDGLAAAVEHVLASAGAIRAADYGPTGERTMAVIIQSMIAPAASGVALTADPISGDRASVVVTAVRGVGERLVSGAAVGDEWLVRRGSAVARRRPERAIDHRQAGEIAREAGRIAAARGVPQDIEWAFDAAGALWILQARPMTALPPDVSWDAPAAGAYTRSLRFGEWISEPVTPLFESWLLTMMEEQLHAKLRAWIGQVAPRPYHVVVNGWYFYSINFLTAGAMLRSLPTIIRQVFRAPRRVAGVIPPTVRHSIPTFEREWREDIQPRYRAAVAAADAKVETAPLDELPALVDGLATLAGEYFASIAALGGSAYKMEMNLARAYRSEVRRSPGGSHLPLLAGLHPPAGPGRHAVESLDWWHEPARVAASPVSMSHDRTALIETRRAAEAAAFAALSGAPSRLRSFRTLLAETQRLVPIREEQAEELTIAWPAMRRAVRRIGEVLTARKQLVAPDDVFFLTRAELLAGLRGEPLPTDIEIAVRKSLREQQARLVPPLMLGSMSPMLRRVWEMFPKLIGAVRSERALVSGAPASPGRATGAVRVIRGSDQFDELEPGEILVAPLTAPAWTPLFTRAAAIVTDVGSAASHASVIAREYGIPAVVGCGDATARLRTGMRVMVDGSTGSVELA